MKKLGSQLLVAAFLLVLVSCSHSRKAVYFNNVNESTFEGSLTNVDPIIQNNDLLSISVSSANPEATVVFNSPNLPAISASSANGSVTQSTGYLVNAQGQIKFPVLGSIQAAGISKKQLTDNLTTQLVNSRQLVDPIVNVRLLNFKVTVLGEVARPTVITVANEKISILEALGMAGDLTMYAKRDNIMLVREEEGKKIVRRINLNSSETFTSPYYYLKSNDVLYAEPNETKVTATGTTKTILPIVLSGLSFVGIILTRVF